MTAFTASTAKPEPAGPEQTITEQTPGQWLKSVRATGTWEGSMTTLVESRGFTFRTDEPEPIGGNDKFPTPMQYVVGAVNGCVTVVIEAVADELGIAIEGIETFSHAHQDVRGFQGTADVSPHFKDFTLTIGLQTPVPESELDELKAQVEKRCPAINLVRDAGVEFTIDWQINTRLTNPAQVQA